VKVRLSGSNLDSESVPPADWWCRGSHGHNVTGAISVAQFELRCDALFQRSMQPVKDALERANVEPFEVDEVVLVGGSSRLPRQAPAAGDASARPAAQHSRPRPRCRPRRCHGQ